MTDAKPAADVETWVEGHVGRIRLNRPSKINALTEPMVRAVRQALARWHADDAVIAVLLDGAGERGLCAGGDIAALYDAIGSKSTLPKEFWTSEYRMNLEIAEYGKPFISLMHGITFGAGIGIAAHAPIRVVTDGTSLAMPETAIGFVPDVGGRYLLARTPGEVGTHAALTGQRFGPGDAIVLGLADHYISHDRWPTLVDALVRLDGPTAGLAGPVSPGDTSGPAGPGTVRAMVDAFAQPTPPSEWWETNRWWVDECYAGDDLGEIRRRLGAHRAPGARVAAAAIDRYSPTSLLVTLRAMRDARTMTLAQVLQQDWLLANAFARHPDFPEGVRAKVIDKDGAPRWTPARTEDVRPEVVDAFFRPASDLGGLWDVTN